MGDHQGRPSAPTIHRFNAIDIWRVTSRVIIIIIINKKTKQQQDETRSVAGLATNEDREAAEIRVHFFLLSRPFLPLR
jgi:hypothetical protein